MCGMHSIVSANRMDIIVQIIHDCYVHVLTCAYAPLFASPPALILLLAAEIRRPTTAFECRDRVKPATTVTNK